MINTIIAFLFLLSFIFELKGRTGKVSLLFQMQLYVLPDFTKSSLPYSLKLNVKEEEMKKEVREVMMRVYLTKREYQQVIESSTRAGLSISTFARNVCLGSEVKSIENHQTRKDMLKVNGDLGRLGGLLKLAITETSEQVSIRPILRDIERMKDELKKKIKAL